MDNNLETKFEYKGKPYVVIPDVIFDIKNINATDKIVLSIISSFNNEYNFVSTKYIAKTLNLSVRTIQQSITNLLSNNHLDMKYRGKIRTFKSLVNLENATDKALIPSDILGRSDLSSTYKLTYGVIAYLGLNINKGYDFKTAEELAKELNISVSSVYRHIASLLNKKDISRLTSGNFMFSANDKYSKHIIKQKIREVNRRQEIEDTSSIELTPNAERALDKIYNRL